MANLIDPFTGQWDEDLVRDTFITVDVERILMVPLSEHVTDDFDDWQYTKNNIFTVRSTYYTEWNNRFGSCMQRNDGQGSSRVNPVWDHVWKLNVPACLAKVKSLCGEHCMEWYLVRRS
jgi:hypothetical protein